MSARPSRTLADIDRDLMVERALLEYEARNGRKSDGACATWRHIDSLLEERLRLAQSLPDLHGASPGGQHG
jgi:hypothetical protein